MLHAAPLPPRQVTLAELRQVLTPVCRGWGWAEAAITDLWHTGTPVPTGPGAPEVRILFPRQFEKWWHEVQVRQGLSQGAHESYGALFPHIR